MNFYFFIYQNTRIWPSLRIWLRQWRVSVRLEDKNFSLAAQTNKTRHERRHFICISLWHKKNLISWRLRYSGESTHAVILGSNQWKVCSEQKKVLTRHEKDQKTKVHLGFSVFRLQKKFSTCCQAGRFRCCDYTWHVSPTFNRRSNKIIKPGAQSSLCRISCEFFFPHFISVSSFSNHLRRFQGCFFFFNYILFCFPFLSLISAHMRSFKPPFTCMLMRLALKWLMGGKCRFTS